MIFLGCDISIDFFCAFSFEILCNETLKIHSEIIVHKLQSGIIVLDHQICVFADNVNLLNFLFIIFTKGTIVFCLITDFVVKNQTLDLHAVIKNQKSALQLHRADF